MRCEKCTPLTLGLLCAPLTLTALSLHALDGGAIGGGAASDAEMAGGRANLDEIVMTLVGQLSKGHVEARDAAMKLGQMGSQGKMAARIVPVLADVMNKATSEQVKHYAIVALSLIRDPSAARVLLPLLEDKKADPNLRLLAVNAVGSADLEEGLKPLQVAATEDESGDLRFKALMALSVMPTAWKSSEKIFVERLSDPRDDVRQLAAKTCHQVATLKIYYFSAEPKLLELAEKDSIPQVRFNAIAALARMKSRLAVAMLIRVLGDAGTSDLLAKQTLGAAQNLTGVPFRNKDGALTWWEKYGKAEYEKAKPLQPEKRELPPDPKAPATKTPEAKTPETKTSAAAEEPKLPKVPDDQKAKDMPFDGVIMPGQ